MGFCVRFYRLGEIPEGFHADEVAFGYNAYSILKTGRDEYGKLFPLSLHSYGDDKPALYAYITIPFIKLYGLTEQAVRLPSAIFGVITIIAVYICCFVVTKRRDLSLLASGVSAFSPVLIVQSRVQSNPIISFTLLLIVIIGYIRWVNTKRLLWLVFSFICLIASSFCYLTPQHFMPFFFPYLLFKDRKKYSPGMWFSIGIYCIAFLSIIGWQVLAGGTRYGQISVLSNPTIMLPLEEQIREDGVLHIPPFIARIFHNKVYAYGKYMGFTLKEYFSYNFLFHEAQQPLRELIPSVGIFYFIELFFLWIGLITYIRKPPHYTAFLIIWTVSSVIGLSLTIGESPNIHRFLIALFPFFIVIAQGITTTIQWFSQRMPSHKGTLVGWSIIGILYSINLIFFLHQMFIHQPIHLPYGREYPYKDLVLAIKKYAPSYDVIISQKILEDMLFYWPIDPRLYQALGSPRDTDDNWMQNYFFAAIPCPSGSSKYRNMVESKNALFIDRGECVAKPEEIIEIIRWRDGSPAFKLVVPKGPLEANTSL